MKIVINRVLDEIISCFDGELSDSISEASRSQLKAVIASSLRHVDLVPRDEFDAQASVLLRTRELLQNLELRFAELEATIEQNTATKNKQ